MSLIKFMIYWERCWFLISLWNKSRCRRYILALRWYSSLVPETSLYFQGSPLTVRSPHEMSIQLNLITGSIRCTPELRKLLCVYASLWVGFINTSNQFNSHARSTRRRYHCPGVYWAREQSSKQFHTPITEQGLNTYPWWADSPDRSGEI